MKGKVVEYFGLPASGKTWQLLNGAYCKLCRADTHAVPLGSGREKITNTCIGIIHNFNLSMVLFKIAIRLYNMNKSKFLLRPFLVIPERYGRILRISRTTNTETHIDEGVFQFIWRVFSEQKKEKKTLELLEKCISVLRTDEHSIVYISCPKSIHIAQVTERNKVSSHFDAGIINGDQLTYDLGRYWMAQILKIGRKHKFEIVYNLNKQA